MKRIPKIISLSIMLLTLSIKSHSQFLKFKTIAYGYQEYNDTSWGKWSELAKAKALVTLDSDENRIKIYSNETQVYDVIKSFKNKGGLVYTTINNKGVKCHIEFDHLEDDDVPRLYITMPDIRVMYFIKKAD